MKNNIHKVPVYNQDGTVDKEIIIEDSLEFLGGRVWKGNKGYYKGVGVPYYRHAIPERPPKDSDYTYFGRKSNFYSGYSVERHQFMKKTGIFKEPFLPMYDDWIGGCGPKEGLLYLSSFEFKKSGVEVIDVVNVDEETNHNYYLVDYKSGRTSYKEQGDPKEFNDLLTYMLEDDWNFLWDKKAIYDVDGNSLVTDTADLFRGSDLNYKLGTVYAALYSMHMLCNSKYHEFVEWYGLHHQDLASIVENSVAILSDNGVDISPLNVYDNRLKNYRHIILNHLVHGKNTAHCACDMYAEHGEEIKKQYIERMSKELKDYE